MQVAQCRVLPADITTRWYNKKIFIKDYSVPGDFSWIENYKLTCLFVIFEPLSYCFEEKIGFDEKASFTSRPLSRLISWYNKLCDITKEFWEKAIQFHGTFHGLKITNWCKKIPCYMRDSTCRWFIVKKAKIFWNHVKHFWIVAGLREYNLDWSMQISFFELPSHICQLT